MDKNKLIEDHLWLIPSACKRHLSKGKSKGLRSDEVYAEATLYLVEAAHRFVDSGKVKFSTYAWYAIKNRMYHYKKAKRQPKVIFESQLPPDRITPFDTAVDETTNEELITLQGGQEKLIARVAAQYSQNQNNGEARGKALVPRDMAIYRLRMAGHTLQTVADAFHISRERVNQIVRKIEAAKIEVDNVKT